jgi:hypothetical protein
LYLQHREFMVVAGSKLLIAMTCCKPPSGTPYAGSTSHILSRRGYDFYVQHREFMMMVRSKLP